MLGFREDVRQKATLRTASKGLSQRSWRDAKYLGWSSEYFDAVLLLVGTQSTRTQRAGIARGVEPWELLFYVTDA